MQSVKELVPFSFTDLHKECLSLVFRRIVDYYGARLVSLIVFGCYAFGKPRFDSDLDLLIVMRSGYWSRLSERTKEFVSNVEQSCGAQLQRLFEEGISMDLSPIILTPDEAQRFLPIYLDMADQCLIVHDVDEFFAGVLEKVKRQMARWGSERRNVSGHWLWEIRPGLKWHEVLRYDE